MGTYHSIVLKDESACDDSNLIQYIMDKPINMRCKNPKWSPSLYESTTTPDNSRFIFYLEYIRKQCHKWTKFVLKYQGDGEKKILTPRLFFNIDAIFRMIDSPVPDRYVI
jgi:hypothetical protein